MSGTRKCAPIPARITFGFQGSTVSGENRPRSLLLPRLRAKAFPDCRDRAAGRAPMPAAPGHLDWESGSGTGRPPESPGTFARHSTGRRARAPTIRARIPVDNASFCRDSGSPCRTRSSRGTAPASSASWTARYPSTTNAPSAARRSRRARERTRAMAGLAAEVMTSFEGVSLRSGGATSFRGCRLRLRGSRFA